METDRESAKTEVERITSDLGKPKKGWVGVRPELLERWPLSEKQFAILLALIKALPHGLSYEGLFDEFSQTGLSKSKSEFNDALFSLLGVCIEKEDGKYGRYKCTEIGLATYQRNTQDFEHMNPPKLSLENTKDLEIMRLIRDGRAVLLASADTKVRKDIPLVVD